MMEEGERERNGQLWQSKGQRYDPVFVALFCLKEKEEGDGKGLGITCKGHWD